MPFPGVTGSDLQRQKLKLPQDFQGKLNLVLIAFEHLGIVTVGAPEFDLEAV